MSEREDRPVGKVFLVGAGPGDPRLLTLWADHLLKKADVIIYDRLVSEEILSLVPEGRKMVCVGKTPGGRGPSQEEINELLRREATEGRIVLRLKGGDPFLFGRGGEEAEYLARHGVDYEVVPGISSALAAPACAGIPVTHRGIGRSVAIVTGQTCDGDLEGVDWEGISRSCDTLVVLMGGTRMGEIVEKLVAGGRSPLEPAAAISWGSTGRQATVRTELGSLESKANEAGLTSPLLLVVGKVVELGQRLAWREKLPLHGKRVLTLRDPRQARSLCLKLADLGASVRNVPAVRMVEHWDPAQDRVVERIRDFDWAIFTSPNAVTFFLDRLMERGKDARDLGSCRIAAIGPGTGKALAARGLRADLIPENHTTQGLMEALTNVCLGGGHVLLCRSNLASPHLADFLRQRGAEVEEVHPYRTEIAHHPDASLIRSLKRSEVDVILFTSPSTVDGLLALLNRRKELLTGVVLGCIGPVTDKRAREWGLAVSFTAKDHSEDGLVEALLEHLKEAPGKTGGEGA